MIFGIGTDIVEVARIEKILSKEHGFREKVFTPGEINYCNSKKNPAESYAARFAAKEAFFKALGTGWAGEMQFTEIEIISGNRGEPIIALHGNVHTITEAHGIDNVYVSLSHTTLFATAIILLEKCSNGLPPRINFTRTR